MNNSIYAIKKNKTFVAENCGRYSHKVVEVGIEENDYLINGGIVHQTRYAFFCGVRRIGDVSIVEDENDHCTIRDFGYGAVLFEQFQLVK